MNPSKFSKIVASSLVCAVLVACGGGGGSGGPVGTLPPTDPTPPTVPAGPVPLASTIVKALPSQPVQSSLVGAEETAAFNRLNDHRSACGFGYLNFEPLLTKSAENHARYMALTSIYSHDEVAGNPGFTGVTPVDRVKAVGYPEINNYAGEALYFRETVNKVGAGVQGVRTLMGAPYHMANILQGFRDIGFSIRSGAPASGVAKGDFVSLKDELTFTTANLGMHLGDTYQMQAEDEVLTYPCQGITDVSYNLLAESPSPVAYLNNGRDLTTNPIGQPIFVNLRTGRQLVITSATVTAPNATGVVGNVELLPILTQANDTNKGYLQASQAMILPAKSLAKDTWHTVSIVGTNNGVTFTKTFQFRTGSAENY